MQKSFEKLLQGYNEFRKKYTLGDTSIMQHLSRGQQPEVMVVACCDSRVDPALILQCDPGELFVVRNVANIVPPYDTSNSYPGVSAALEFGVCFLQVKHLILLGHSGCGGINALMKRNDPGNQNEFINKWVSGLDIEVEGVHDVDACSKMALHKSYQNSLTFPWIKQRLDAEQIKIHMWFFDIKQGQIFTRKDSDSNYISLL